MKKFLIFGLLGVTALITKADELRFKAAAVDDPLYEWMQYDEKEARCMLTKENILELDNRDPQSGAALTYTELPINMKDDEFRVNMVLAPVKISADHKVGVVFDFEDDRNLRYIVLDDKQFYIYSIRNGERALIKKGLYKISPFSSSFIQSDLNVKGNKDNIMISLEKKNGKLTFMVNDLPMGTLKNIELNHPAFGFTAIGKTKLKVYGLEYAKESPEDREME